MGIHDYPHKRRHQTLDQLEDVQSDDPGSAPTSLVARCLRLRQVPLNELSSEDLRLLIGQRQGLMFLVPLALEQLEVDPLVETDYYPGDLLCAVLRAGADFWHRHQNLRVRVERILTALPEVPPDLAVAVRDFQPSRRR